MTEPGYLIWLVATAATTITVLTVGTLAAAEVPPRPRRRQHRRSSPDADPTFLSRETRTARPTTPPEHGDRYRAA